jgi:hypothetical protein
MHIPRWSGSAADAFWAAFAPQAANWYQVCDSFSGGANELRAYAGELRATHAVRRGRCEARQRYLGWGVPVCDATRTSDEAGRRATQRPVRRRLTCAHAVGRW